MWNVKRPSSIYHSSYYSSKCTRCLVLKLFLKLSTLGFSLSVLSNLFQRWSPKYTMRKRRLLKLAFHRLYCSGVVLKTIKVIVDHNLISCPLIDASEKKQLAIAAVVQSNQTITLVGLIWFWFNRRKRIVRVAKIWYQVKKKTWNKYKSLLLCTTQRMQHVSPWVFLNLIVENIQKNSLPKIVSLFSYVN